MECVCPEHRARVGASVSWMPWEGCYVVCALSMLGWTTLAVLLHLSLVDGQAPNHGRRSGRHKGGGGIIKNPNRQIINMGIHTLAVTLPMDWVRENGIKAGQMVRLTEIFHDGPGLKAMLVKSSEV